MHPLQSAGVSPVFASSQVVACVTLPIGKFPHGIVARSRSGFVCLSSPGHVVLVVPSVTSSVRVVRILLLVPPPVPSLEQLGQLRYLSVSPLISSGYCGTPESASRCFDGSSWRCFIRAKPRSSSSILASMSAHVVTIHRICQERRL